MELAELRERLTRFLRAHLDDPAAEVTYLEPGPGHAGFSYLFDAIAGGETRRYFLRLPPPNVRWEGTADVLRQVAALRALRGTGVPHAPVLWAGDDLQWFDRPYFIQPRVAGDVLRPAEIARLTPAERRDRARQAMAALAGIHRADWQEAAGYLGPFWGFETDVTRWDRFAERAAEPERLALQPEVRRLLLAQAPTDARLGLCHGDFQWANLMYTPDGRLAAVIDWELTGIGPVLSDLGWICFFNDPQAWPPGEAAARMPGPEDLAAFYREASGEDLGALRWFQALAAYKFAVITGFNLMLHRRGKRVDPHWEERVPGMETNLAYAHALLTG
ncbi:MAG TPA: phosphotransferase family protein [Dehalococcoidia bacterium]